MSEKPEGSSLPKFWTVLSESETNNDDDPPIYYDDPPIYFTSQGERYIYPHDLVHSKHAWDKVKKFEALVKDQNLQRAQGLGFLSSEDSTQQK